MNCAYYFDRSAKYGNLTSLIGQSANTRYLWCWRYAENSADPYSVWGPDLIASAADAVNKGQGLHVNVNLQAKQTPLREFLEDLKPYWDSITCIEAADEPKPRQIAGFIRQVKDAIRSLHLPMKPIGVCFTTKQWPEKVTSKGMDVVIIEAYLEPPGDHNSPYNVEMLMKYLDGALKAVVKQKKKAIVVPMSYSRGGQWQHIIDLERDSPAWRQAVKTLVDLQEPIYKLCISQTYKSTVVGLNFFSFGREFGAYGDRHKPPVPEYPALHDEILRIGRKAVRLS